MAYDPTTLTASVVIDGADVREHFELEILGIKGNRSLRLMHRAHESPVSHGTDLQGGTYSVAVLRLSGWMPASKRAALLRHLHNEPRFPGAAREGGTIVLRTDDTVAYRFDSVARVDFEAQSRQWRTDPDVNTVLEFKISHVIPIRIAPVLQGMSPAVAVDTFPAAATTPAFSILAEGVTDPGMGFQGAVLEILGPATNPSIASAENGPTFLFDGSLDGKDNDGSTLTAAIHQPTNLVTDGDMEKNGTADWTSTNATLTKQPRMDTFRVMNGTQCMKVGVTAANGFIEQSFTPSANADVHIAFWHFGTGPAGNRPYLKVLNNAGGTIIDIRIDSLGAAGYSLVEVTVPCDASAAAHKWQLYGLGGSETFWIDDLVISESKMTNGQMGTGFGAGVPTGWAANGSPTTAESSGDFHGLTSAWDVTLDAAAKTVDTPSISFAAGTVYQITGRVKGVTNATSSRIRVMSASANEVGLAAEFTPVIGTWTRFAFHFAARATESGRIRFEATGIVQVIIDSVSVVALSAKGATDKYHWEPGPYGRALQMGLGECLKISGSMNRANMTAIAQVVPRFGTLTDDLDFGSCTIWHASFDRDSQFGQTYDEGTGAPVAFRHAGGVNVVGVASDYSGGVQPMKGAGRGVLGVGMTLSDGTWAAATQRVFVEEIDTTSGLPFVQRKSGESTAINFLADAPDVILLSDCGHWAGFWTWNYPRELTKVLGELVAAEPPASDNKSLLWTGTLDEGDSLMIDVGAYKMERWDADHATAKLTDASPGLTGDIPRWKECPVLYVDSNIPMIRSHMRPLG